jgi:hypothetical protein
MHEGTWNHRWSKDEMEKETRGKRICFPSSREIKTPI